jgi:mRNA interferase RelE/StbE
VKNLGLKAEASETEGEAARLGAPLLPEGKQLPHRGSSVSYAVVYDNKALESLERLPKEIRKRIVGKVSDSKENPRHFFERLAGRTDYKLRVGDYRVIADLNDAEKRVEVTLIDHRKRVYKRLG